MGSSVCQGTLSTHFCLVLTNPTASARRTQCRGHLMPGVSHTTSHFIQQCPFLRACCRVPCPSPGARPKKNRGQLEDFSPCPMSHPLAAVTWGVPMRRQPGGAPVAVPSPPVVSVVHPCVAPATGPSLLQEGHLHPAGRMVFHTRVALCTHLNGIGQHRTSPWGYRSEYRRPFLSLQLSEETTGEVQTGLLPQWNISTEPS